MSWLEKILPKSKITTPRRHNIPEGVWTKCSACEQVLYRAELERNLEVCPKCDHHMRISARARLESFLDEQGRTEIGAELEPQDVLKFKDSKRYKDRLSAAQKETGEKDALVVMKGTLKGVPVVACSFEFSFIGGSMSSVVGARFVRAVEESIKEGRGLVCFSTSGGARMQEALFSLMQMAKTSAALDRLSKAGLPYISVLTDPTMGGVSASLAMLGDINVGEPKGTDRLCRSARHRADRAREAAGRLPALRVPAGEGRHRPHHRSSRDAQPSGQPARQNAEYSRHRRVKMSSNMQQSQSRSLVDWLSYLEQIHPVNIDMGLDRVGAVAHRMGLTQLPFKVITVAGTNGKGSSCAMAASILMEAGYQVGVYSSPHLLRFTERVRINGAELADSDHCTAFAEVEAARGEIALTFFEFATLAGLWLFRRAAPDVLLLEVGLGGRLDATNVVESDVAMITSIALDHCDWLGDTREAVAVEKAGVYRAGKPAISGEPNPPVTIASEAARLGACLRQVGIDFRGDEHASGWDYHGLHQWRDLPKPALPLMNAVTVLAALESPACRCRKRLFDKGWPMPGWPGGCSNCKARRWSSSMWPTTPIRQPIWQLSCARCPVPACVAPWSACSRTRTWRARLPSSMASSVNGIWPA